MEKMRADAFTDLNLKDRDAPLPLGPEGAMLLASFLPVMGGLTSLDLSNNRLCSDVNLLGRGTYTTDGITAIADALRVNGGLTSLNLAQNQLCGIWTDWMGNKHGNYTTDGITAIADALRVNGGLTKVR